MTDQEIKNRINLILGETIADATLTGYLSSARELCAEAEYKCIGLPEEIDYSRYDSLVIDSIVFGFTIRGAEGQSSHNENGIQRTFKYGDMRDYISKHTIPYVNMR